MLMQRVVLFASLAAVASGKIWYSENFNDDQWSERWTLSKWKDDSEIGTWEHTAGEWFADEDDKGIKTAQDARFYGISSEFSEPFSNEGKPLAIMMVVKHEQNIDCGGAYVKLLPAGADQESFGGESPYSIMFGPDICGSTRKTHVIFNYRRPDGKGKAKNLEHNRNIRCESDEHAHVYTLFLKTDNTFDVRIDGESVQSGTLSEGWDFQPPKMIKDPEQSRPENWVTEEKIPDPEDKKPEGYDDIPMQIPDPEAKKPEDWDDEDDGEWEAPMIDNEEYKGEWAPRMIDNPDYTGEWVHPTIPNPEYFEDENMYAVCKNCAFVGFELWQVKSGTLFDDIYVMDDLDEAEIQERKLVEKLKKIKDVKEQIEKEKMEIEKQKMEKEKDEEDEDEDEEELKLEGEVLPKDEL